MEFLSGKSALITGGLGFVGSNLARNLVQHGCNVRIIDSLIPDYGGNRFNVKGIENQCEIHISDTRDVNSLRHHVLNCDYIFNLAAQTSHLGSMEDPQTDLDINTGAQINLLELCRKTNPNVKIVYASTRQLYGKPEYLPVDEKHPVVPVDINGINKFGGEQLHLFYDRLYGVKSTVLRLTNTYGPRIRIKDAKQMFLGVWIKCLLNNEPILVYGDGKQIRDFNYVDDVVNAMIMSAKSETANSKVYNLGSRETVNLLELAELMVEIFGGGEIKVIPFPPGRKAIDIGDYYADTARIESDLGWKEKTSLKTGLAQTIDYFKEFSGHYY